MQGNPFVDNYIIPDADFKNSTKAVLDGSSTSV
jgi:hypothetical protein